MHLILPKMPFFQTHFSPSRGLKDYQRISLKPQRTSKLMLPVPSSKTSHQHRGKRFYLWTRPRRAREFTASACPARSLRLHREMQNPPPLTFRPLASLDGHTPRDTNTFAGDGDGLCSNDTVVSLRNRNPNRDAGRGVVWITRSTVSLTELLLLRCNKSYGTLGASARHRLSFVSGNFKAFSMLMVRDHGDSTWYIGQAFGVIWLLCSDLIILFTWVKVRFVPRALYS